MIQKSKFVVSLYTLIKKLKLCFREWIGKAIAACLILVVVKMAQARRKMVHKKKEEDAITVSTESDQTMTESIVSAQYGLIKVHQLMQHVNVTIMKLRSIYTSKASKVTTVYITSSPHTILFSLFRKCVFYYSGCSMQAW